jgi:hypothetical protein
MSTGDNLRWVRGDHTVFFRDTRFVFPERVASACELPTRDGYCVVTFLDDAAPASAETNGLVYRSADCRLHKVTIEENNRTIHLLGCYEEGETVVLMGSNDVLYAVDPKLLRVIHKRYYR